MISLKSLAAGVLTLAVTAAPAAADTVHLSACSHDGQTVSANVKFSIVPAKDRLNEKDMQEILRASFKKMAAGMTPDQITHVTPNMGMSDGNMMLFHYFDDVIARTKKPPPEFTLNLDNDSVTATPGCSIK